MKKLIALLVIVSFLIIPSASYKVNANICNFSPGMEGEALDNCLREQRRQDQIARDQLIADAENAQEFYEIKIAYFYKLDGLEKQLDVFDTNGQCRFSSTDCLQSMRIPSNPTTLGANVFLNFMENKEKCFDHLSQCIAKKMANTQTQQPIKTDDQICSEKFGPNWKWDGVAYCVCKDGYTQKNGDCVSYDQACNISYPNTKFLKIDNVDGHRICDCKNGYVWNKQRTGCIIAPVVPVKTNDQICSDTYGINSNWNGTKNDNGGLICDCKTGYEWNYNQTACIKKEIIIPPKVKGVSENNNFSIPEGALIRATNGIDIYIVKYVGTKKFKRLILSPSVFNNYGHLRWEDVMDVDWTTLNSFATSDLVRAVGDDKIYRLYSQGDKGQKRMIKNNSVLARLGFDPDSIYEINRFDRESYLKGLDLE